MRIELQVEMTDGRTTEVVASTPEQVRLEQHFGIDSAEMFQQVGTNKIVLDENDPEASTIDMPIYRAQLQHLSYVAWCALRRRQPEAGWPDTFDAFLDQLEDLRIRQPAPDDEVDGGGEGGDGVGEASAPQVAPA